MTDILQEVDATRPVVQHLVPGETTTRTGRSTELRRKPKAAPIAYLKRRPWLLGLLAFLPFVLIRAGTLAESDTFWEIRTGSFILANRTIPRLDPFSWTAHGKPWTLNSWSFDVLIGAAYRAGGLPAVALLSAGLVTVVVAVVLSLARHSGASAAVASALLWVSTPLIVGWFSARPQLIDYLAVLILVVLMRRLLEDRRPVGTLLCVAALHLLWVNLHAGALLGVGILGATTVLAGARHATRWRVPRLALATLLAGLASFANPYGFGLIGQTFAVKDASSGVIVEWRHLNPLHPAEVITFVTGLLALAIAFRTADIVAMAALAVTAVGAVDAVRFLPILLLVALPVLAAWLSHERVRGYILSRRVMLVGGASLAVVATTSVSLAALSHLGQPSPSIYPVATIKAIPSGCRVFTPYGVGGFVLLVRPDVRVSLDSRNDLYGAALVTRLQGVYDKPDDLAHQLAGADCVLAPVDSALAHELDRSTDWVRPASEPAGSLYVRSTVLRRGSDR